MDKKTSTDLKKTLRTVFGNSPDQHILNVVKESCQEAFNLPTFTQTLQTIKSHFFDRNYDAVFQNPAHLPVYSARYAPSRALCYYHLFLAHPVLMKTLEGPSTILCIGSGAGSELVGITAAMVHANPVSKTKKKKAATTSSSGKSIKEKSDETHKLKEGDSIPKEDSAYPHSGVSALNLEKMNINSATETSEAEVEEASVCATTTASEAVAAKPKKSKTNKHQVTIVIQDYVDWAPILGPMETVVRERMVLGPERLRCETEVGDVLNLSEGLLDRVAKADLITFMFVLNELFQDKKKTMLLVAKIVAAMPSGAHMLVVDSAGSFSNLKVGERTYMVYMLLDHLKSLEVVYQDDSIWYRCPPSATYPLKLENMRHFVRIYKKI